MKAIQDHRSIRGDLRFCKKKYRRAEISTGVSVRRPYGVGGLFNDINVKVCKITYKNSLMATKYLHGLSLWAIFVLSEAGSFLNTDNNDYQGNHRNSHQRDRNHQH